MPSPFPGMDPFLEGSLWTTVHFALGAEMVRELAPQIRPRYVVLPVERLVVIASTPDSLVTTTAALYPDASILALSSVPDSQVEPSATAAPLLMATVMPVSIPHVTLEIRDTATRQLVTAIEILSPTNKRGEGREEYLAKRQRVLLSPAHLLEIDLLRQGQRVPMQQPLPATPYVVLLSRAEQRPITEVWPINLDQALPTIPVPLLPGDPDVTLNLQRSLNNVYDMIGYDLIIDYAQAPDIPLAHTEATWVDSQLRIAGHR